MRVRFVVLALALALPTAGAFAQDPAFEALGLDSPKLLEPPTGSPLSGAELDRRTEEVASLMRCPVCQGLSIADSPVDSAVAMKQEVRDMLAAGYSQDQVLTYFERSYGEFIRLSPKAKGFNLLVWLVPIVGVLAGAWLVVARMRAARPAGAAAERPALDPELEPYLERVRREVRG